MTQKSLFCEFCLLTLIVIKYNIQKKAKIKISFIVKNLLTTKMFF